MPKLESLTIFYPSYNEEANVERVTNAAEISAFAEAWTGQSMFRRDPTELDQVWIFRLVSR